MSETFPRPKKRAAGILLMTRNHPQKFLLMKHPRRWDLPKGHSEPGETDQQTALRETEEETGIISSKISLDPDFRYELSYPVTYKKKKDTVFEKTVIYLLGFIDVPVTPTLTEHDSYAWFDWTPPHRIQTQTIDGLLQAVEKHLENRSR